MGLIHSRVRAFSTITPTEDREPLPATGRAGRNLPAAFAVGIFLGAIVIGSVIVAKPVFLALAIIADCIALYELARAFKRADVTLILPVAWVGTIGMGICAYTLGAEALLGAFVVTIIAIVLWRIGDGWNHRAFHDVFVSIFSLSYVSLLTCFAVLMLAQQRNPAPLLIWVLTTISNDLGGYFTGIFFGKHPLAPKVSPSKSWEGFAGSALMCMAVASISLSLAGYTWWIGLFIGVFTACAATLGDLGESLIKRDVGLKDMGHLLPGHGGLMDRLDSLLVTAPLFYLFFSKIMGW
ncbi:MAG: phosphatidate cytidylyltransferase [Actinomycetaceae bacterium]|nr:phosphatidate cytidylyltransferase [Actinomycetaceae bacterium]